MNPNIYSSVSFYLARICIASLLLQSVVQCAFKQQCYTCNGVDSISACNETKQCTFSQACYMEEYRTDTGELMYFGGCAEKGDCKVTMHLHGARPGAYFGLSEHNGVRMCATCCRNVDLCNAHLCGKSVLGPSHGIVPTQNNAMKCFSCDGVYSIQQCSVTEMCNSGQQCYLELYARTDGLMRYYGGCISDLACTKTGLPTHYGERICGVCCNHDYCNSNLCGQQIQVYQNGHLTGPQNRRCLQCYDQYAEELGLCRNSVECTSSTSKCAIVMRKENDLVTVDMDCEENLSCSSKDAPPNQMCAACCTSDNCNQKLDCTSATTEPAHQSYRGVECEVCDGDSCGLVQLATVKCPDDIAPFCMNEITNDVDGDKHVRKRCGSVSECEAARLGNSSENNNCSNFDPSAIYTSSFQCTYCCATPNCNRNIVPDVGTQYFGFK